MAEYVADDRAQTTLTTTQTEICKPNPKRRVFAAVNYGGNPCYIQLGTAPSIYIFAGGSFEITLVNPWYGYIYATAIGGNTSLSAVEVSEK